MMKTTGTPSPLMGEDKGGGGYGMFPLTHTLSHQGRGEIFRGIF